MNRRGKRVISQLFCPVKPKTRAAPKVVGREFLKGTTPKYTK
jgi:hypothetical protein